MEQNDDKINLFELEEAMYSFKIESDKPLIGSTNLVIGTYGIASLYLQMNQIYNTPKHSAIHAVHDGIKDIIAHSWSSMGTIYICTTKKFKEYYSQDLANVILTEVSPQRIVLLSSVINKEIDNIASVYNTAWKDIKIPASKCAAQNITSLEAAILMKAQISAIPCALHLLQQPEYANSIEIANRFKQIEGSLGLTKCIMCPPKHASQLLISMNEDSTFFS